MPSFVRAQLDYYSALGIDPMAGTVEVNIAFRRMAWRYHPDRNREPGATSQFQYINEARQALSDPMCRAAYDARRLPETPFHYRSSPAPLHPHPHRTSHRRHRVRAVLLTLVTFVFVASAWIAILMALTSKHYSMPTDALGVRPSYQAEMTLEHAFSMEIYPVSYTDEQGHR